MWSWWRVVLVGVALAAVAACGDDDAAAPPDGGDTPAGDEALGEPAADFTWETVLDQDGYGYVLTVEGVVGADHATYRMQVEPIIAEDGDEFADAVAHLAGAAVNGSAAPGTGIATTEGDIDPDGSTEVIVVGDQRWYRNPWVAEELSFATRGAEWVRVPAGDPVIVDLATAVLNERYDAALRRLLDAVRAGEPIEAPAPDAASALDEILVPWIGLVGPAHPGGAEATTTGDVDQGEVTWREDLDHADGVAAGTVRWRATRAERPVPPLEVIDVAELTAGLAG